MTSRIALGALPTTVLSLSAFTGTPVYQIQEIPARVGERYYETPYAMNDLGQFVGSSVRLNSDNRPTNKTMHTRHHCPRPTVKISNRRIPVADME
jgi:hypothetical protein